MPTHPLDVRIAHLQAGGVSILLDSSASGLPSVVYWGPALGDQDDESLAAIAHASRGPVGDSRIDIPERVSVLPTPAEGWVGRPGILGSRAGQAFSPLFHVGDESAADPDPVVHSGRTYLANDPIADPIY